MITSWGFICLILRMFICVGAAVSSLRVILVGKKKRALATGVTGMMRASLHLLSSSVRTLGSGSRSWLGLLSDSQERAALSGLPNFGLVAHRSVSLSGGGQRLAALSQTGGLLTPTTAKQPASVSASAGLRRGVRVRGFWPLSAELGFSPLCFSGPRGCCVALRQRLEVDHLLGLAQV